MFGQNVILDNVVVKKDILLSTMRDNLKAHKAEVEELLELRITKAIGYFRDQVSLILVDGWEPETEIKFPIPVDNSRAYEKAISMVEMDIREEIELTGDQFDKLIQDNWDWKSHFLNVSGMYK